MTSSSVKSGCSLISISSQSACFSNGEILPPIGFAAILPVSCQRCIHLTAELGLTSNRSAASRRDAPVSTASSTVSYTHLRAHETRHDLVCRLLLEKKKTNKTEQSEGYTKPHTKNKNKRQQTTP